MPAKRGNPVARLAPLPGRSRELGFLAGHVPDNFFGPLPGGKAEGTGANYPHKHARPALSFYEPPAAFSRGA